MQMNIKKLVFKKPKITFVCKKIAYPFTQNKVKVMKDENMYLHPNLMTFFILKGNVLGKKIINL